ncbi:MAG TPA: ATP-binding protein [Chitinophagaceae bacterium]|jgi:signal transduction histidine kinase|nr:ATP-binding protein [Chitinophagaceae bacterium]
MTNNLTYLVIMGIAVMLLMVVSILLAVVYNQRKKNQHRTAMEKLREQQQNQLIEAAVRSEETERHRIAETLHDEVGAFLSSAKLHLLGIKSNMLDEKDQKLHDKGKDLLNDVIQKVRGISHNLHSNILKEFGLNEAIRHFIRKITMGTLLTASTALDDNYQTVTPDNDISMYRMVQELVNNIMKYANATEILISSTLDNDELNLVIFHNGDGLTQEQFERLRYQKEGLGLKNIQNRVILLKGSINFTRGSEGYRVNIHVPVKTAVS